MRRPIHLTSSLSFLLYRLMVTRGEWIKYEEGKKKAHEGI
jgi:hypothetical protein